MSTMFEDLPIDEQEDVAAACSARGIDVGDFEFHFNEVFSSSGVGPIDRSVVVFRKGRDGQRIYSAGNGTSWTEEFETELKGGVFG